MLRIGIIFTWIVTNSLNLIAQTTYQEVYEIFQQNCTNGCHTGVNPSGNLDLGASESQVYTNLVDVIPANTYAAEILKQKLVEPGYPERSYLLRKCNNGFDAQLALVNSAEGSPMPDGQPALEDYEIEIIRQWILWGAEQNGTPVNADVIRNYYEIGGVSDVDKPLTPEEEGLEGYQVRFGPIFLNPGEEAEYIKQYRVVSDANKEVYRMIAAMHPYSHHWVVSKLDSEYENQFEAGPMDVYTTSIQQIVVQHGSFVGIWAYSKEIELPLGTAIYQDSSALLALNFHLANYNQDSICKASVYQNIYTHEVGSGNVELIAGTEQYGGENPSILQIPPDGEEHVLTFSFTAPGETYYFYALQGHTHSRGIDFDVYLRNPDGTKGEQIYEGFYDEEYEFNTGWYDFSHAPIRLWNELFEVNMDWGLLVEGTFINNTEDTIGNGMMTTEEMHSLYYLYTRERPSVSVEEVGGTSKSVSIYPNPSIDEVMILLNGDAELIDADCFVYDVFGRLVQAKFDLTGEKLTIPRDGLKPGIYHFTLFQDSKIIGQGRWVFM